MHTVQVAIPGLDNTVTRPVMISIIEQIKSMTRIDVDVPSLYKSTLDELQQNNSSMNRNSNKISPPETNIIVSVSETYPEESYGTTAVNYSEHREVFLDRDARLFIKPVYVDSDVEIEFNYRHKSKTKINEWISNMRIRATQMMDVNLHSLKYKYIMPDPIIQLLTEVYTLRENIAPYNIAIEDYIRDSSDGRLTIVSDTTSKNLELACSETQTRVQGMYDFSASPDKLETDKEYYSVSFTYKFRYQKPIAIQAVYPTTVNNQLLDRKFIVDIDLIQDRPGYGVERDIYLDSLKDKEVQFALHHNASTGILTIPVYDKWEPPIPIKYMGRIVSVLTTITPEDRRTLLNLNDLGDVALDKDILEWILTSEITKVFRLYDSFINIGLYKNENDVMYTDNLVLDPDGTLSSKIDLDLRGEYRVLISLVVDPSAMHEVVLNRHIANRPVLTKLLEAINIRIKSDNVYGVVDTNYVDQIANASSFRLSKLLKGGLTDGRGVQRTVQTSAILSMKS